MVDWSSRETDSGVRKMKKIKFTVEIPIDMVQAGMTADLERDKLRPYKRCWYGDELEHARKWLVGIVTDNIGKHTPQFSDRIDEVHVTDMEIPNDEKNSNSN